MKLKADLHVHTTASDGRLTPVELVRMARKEELSVLAVTDHDSVSGVSAALDEARDTDLLVLPGVEINTDVPGAEVHVLGYCIDYCCGELSAVLENLCRERLIRGQKMVSRLAALGMPVSWKHVQDLAGGGVVGRPHIAQALLEAGHVQSLAEAFQKYLGREGPVYVEREKVSPVEAVRLVNRSGGFAVLAHPHSFGLHRLDEILGPLMSSGLSGVETYYNGFGSYDVESLVAMADENGLLATGGSDFHCLGTPDETPLGGVDMPQDRLEKFLAKAREHMPDLFKTWTLTAYQ